MNEAVQTSPKLYFHDHIVKFIFLPFIPNFVKPNHLTAVRMLLTPVVLWLFFIENYTFGFPLFIFASLTDLVDGCLARVRNQITPWGIFFDPVADKLLIGSVALLVALKYYHPLLVFSAILLDLMPSVRWAFSRHEGGVMMANWWGKWKMFLQFTSLTLLLLGIILHVPALIIAGEVTLAVALVFAGIAVATYSL
jgi:CDP-diacylglycerol--glycerol-3-phosphate 3-phosphatidyltransferase